MSEDKPRNKLYPYIIAIAVSIYISTQVITLVSTANIGHTLQGVAEKQKSIFEFLINQSIENSTRISTYPDIMNVDKNDKDRLLYTLSFNNNIKIYDISFFDLDGNILTDSYEGFISFKSIFGNLPPKSILQPSVQNIRFSELYNDTVIDILVPVFDNGKLVGIMWQVESFERINSAIKNVSILTTGESYIIDSSGKVLTELKYADIRKSPITLKESTIVNDSFNGFEDNIYLDYRDEYVYGYHTILSLNNWKLIVEVDEKEVINTSKNINSFLARSITLILATSKLLEPIYKNITIKSKSTKSNNSTQNNHLAQECKTNSLLCKVKTYFKSCSIFIRYIKYRYILNLLFVSLVCISLIVTIGRIQTDNDIQNNLNLDNQVNVRLISYYVNEVKDNFYSANRTLSEYDSLDLAFFLNRVNSTSSNILNIALLDNSNNIHLNTSNTDINLKYAEQSIENNNILYSTTGISDIFYDKNYNQYVFYLSGRVFDHKTNQWYNSIGVVSFDSLKNILLSQDINSSHIITILNKEKILYSNKYTMSEFSKEYYEKLNNVFYSSNLYGSSIFDVNKYNNIEGVDVFESLSNINTNSIVVYGSYASISGTDWGLLYEEPVSTAKSRIYKTSIDLLVDTCYQYIQTIVQTIN